MSFKKKSVSELFVQESIFTLGILEYEIIVEDK